MNASVPPKLQRSLFPTQTRLILAVALAAFAIKLYCAATTFGTADVTTISNFGKSIDANGMDYLYHTDRLFNHPPLAGSFFWLLYRVSAGISSVGPRGVPAALPFLLRLPSVIADLVSVLILLLIKKKTGKPPVPVLMLFAASPVAFMVSAFHGNTDSVMVCLLLAAAYWCVEENALACGLFLGLACNIKIIPLLMVPVFFFFWTHRGFRKASLFSVGFGLFCLVGWSSALIGSPVQFFKNVLCYPSWAGAWGVTYWYSYVAYRYHLYPDGRFPFERLAWVLTSLKLLIVVSVLTLGWFRRKTDGPGFLGTLAFSWLAFMILAPGFVPYYLVWSAPFLLCYSPRWYVIVTAASSVYLFSYYNSMSRGMPWNIADFGGAPAWPIWGNLPWMAMIAMAAATFVRLSRNVPALAQDVGQS